jgi:3-phenylpropionate/trans-cinnamate dioxygenase ferredoxin component
MTKWHKVADQTGILEDEPVSIKIEDAQIGIYLVNDKLYAIEDICPHAHALLTQGFIEGEEVECPLHEAMFHIPTGKCLREPAERDLQTYEVKVEDGEVFVSV